MRHPERIAHGALRHPSVGGRPRDIRTRRHYYRTRRHYYHGRHDHIWRRYYLGYHDGISYRDGIDYCDRIGVSLLHGGPHLLAC